MDLNGDDYINKEEWVYFLDHPVQETIGQLSTVSLNLLETQDDMMVEDPIVP